MPRTAKTWAPGDTIASVELNKISTDIDTIFSSWDDRLWLYKLSTDGALVVRIGAGTYRVWGAEWQYAGGTVTVWGTATTYIMIDTAGAIQTSTSAWNTNYTRIWVIVSSGWVVTSITKWRNDAVGWVLGGLTFVDTQWSNTTPNDYNDQTFKAQLKTITNIGLNGIATGTYARLIGFRWQTSSTYGLSWEIAYCDDGIYTRSGSTTTWGKWYKNLEESDNTTYLQHLIYNA